MQFYSYFRFMSSKKPTVPIVDFFKKKSTLNYLISFVVCLFLFYPIEYKVNGPFLPPERSLSAAIMGSIFGAGILSAIITFFTMISSRYWLKPIVELIVIISKADNRITVKDQKMVIRSLKSQFGYYKAKRAYRYFQKIKDNDTISVSKACGKLNQVFEASNATVLLDVIVKIAVADQFMSKKEEEIVREIAQKLRVHPNVLNSILARRNFAWESRKWTQTGGANKKTTTSKSSKFRANEILGIPDNSPFADVKKAYRDLAKIYHPDKVMNGVNKEIAKKQFQEISEAYQILKQK